MKILMHVCCANCAIYPVKTLREEGHNLTGFWHNPNIYPFEEYNLRLDSLKDFANRWRFDVIYNDYAPEKFYMLFNPENPPSSPFSKGGPRGILQKGIRSFERCKSCYRLRLEETARTAVEEGFDAFSTTLLISPYQNFEGIADIGNQLADKYNVLFYLKDFRPDFRKAMAVSRELGFYRQKYCGCRFSREERVKKSKCQNVTAC